MGPLSITFGFDADLNGVPETPAILEQVGGDGIDGFLACLGRDTAAPGFAPQLGNFFLRGNAGTDFGLLVITYAGGAVNGASGEIWDIDGLSIGTEQYRVRAFDSGGTLLATIDSPLSTQDSGCANTELDGRPWTFSFAGVPGITRLTIDFIGTKTNGIGLAFLRDGELRARISALADGAAEREKERVATLARRPPDPSLTLRIALRARIAGGAPSGPPHVRVSNSVAADDYLLLRNGVARSGSGSGVARLRRRK